MRERQAAEEDGARKKKSTRMCSCAHSKNEKYFQQESEAGSHKTRRRAVGAPSLAKCNSEKLREMFVIGIVVLSALVASGSEGDESEKEKRAARALFRFISLERDIRIFRPAIFSSQLVTCNVTVVILELDFFKWTLMQSRVESNF